MNRLASLASLLFFLLPTGALAQQSLDGGPQDSLAPPPPGGVGDDANAADMAAPTQPSTAPTYAPAPAPAPAPTTYAPAPAPAPYSPPPTDSTLQTGGLTSAQAAELLEQQRHRKHHVLYIEATAGAHWLNMVSVSSHNFLPPMTVQTTDTGGSGGLALGIRLANFIGIGARGTLGFFPTYNFGTAVGEIGLYLPTEVVEPFVRVGFGYAWVGNANYHDPSMSGTTIYGFVFTTSLGLDIFLGDAISIGAAFDFDVLNLSRQKEAMDVVHATDFDLTTDGNAVGLHIGGHAQFTLHFL